MPVSLIVTDGGVQGLLAIAAAAERGNPEQLSLCWHPGSHPGRKDAERAACLTQSKLYGIAEAPEHKPATMTPRDGFEADSRALLEAALLARHLGGGEVIWPTSAPEAHGGGPDIGAVSRTVNQALLISELVSLAALPVGEEMRRVRVRAPYADLTDRRIADLVLDMNLPVWLCWFWHATDEDGVREREHWIKLLRAAGWTGTFEGAEPPQIVTRPPPSQPQDIRSSASRNNPASRGNGDSR